MHDNRSESDYHYFEGRTLAIAPTTTLKVRRDWRSVTSNCSMTVFADPIALKVASAGREMGLTLDVFFSASWMSLAMACVGT